MKFQREWSSYTCPSRRRSRLRVQDEEHRKRRGQMRMPRGTSSKEAWYEYERGINRFARGRYWVICGFSTKEDSWRKVNFDAEMVTDEEASKLYNIKVAVQDENRGNSEGNDQSCVLFQECVVSPLIRSAAPNFRSFLHWRMGHNLGHPTLLSGKRVWLFSANVGAAANARTSN